MINVGLTYCLYSMVHTAGSFYTRPFPGSLRSGIYPTSLLDAARLAAGDPFIYVKNAQLKEKIDPHQGFLRIIKKPVAIVLFELFPIQDLARLNEFIAKLTNGETIDLVGVRNVSISLTEEIKPIELISEIEAYLVYNFGEYIEIIIICIIDEQTISINPTEIPDALEEAQIQIEEKLPLELHGLYYTGIFAANNKPFLLPSIYFYCAHKLKSYIARSRSRSGST